MTRKLLRSGVAQNSNRRFGADGAKSLVPMKGLVCLTVAITQEFNLLHFLIVLFCSGKKFKQPNFEQIVRLRGS